jgi:hypothetical protein
VTTLRFERALGKIGFPSGGGLFLTQPFPNQDLWGRRPGGAGLAVLRNRTSDDRSPTRVEFFDASGVKTSESALAIAPTPVRAEWLDDFVELKVAAYSHLPSWAPRITADQIRKVLVRPAAAPRAYDVLIPNESEIWVLTTPPEIPDVDANWQVFSRSGVDLGRIELPAGVELRWVEGDRALAVAVGDYDVPSILIYRVTR